MLTIILSVAALFVAVAAAVYARVSAVAATRSATAAEAVDRRERTPQLRLLLDDPVEAPSDKVIYRIRNEGPQDLDVVTVYRPKPPDGITYPIAATGRTSWVDDEVELGPLALTKEARFTFCCGAAEELPDFLVRIECACGGDTWSLSKELPSPRPVRSALGPAPDEVRGALKSARDTFQEIVTRGGEDTSFFLDENRQSISLSLRENAARVGSSALKEALERVAGTWDQAFALAPPDPGPTTIRLDQDWQPDPEYVRRLADVAEVAQRGLLECADALDRLNAEEAGRY